MYRTGPNNKPSSFSDSKPLSYPSIPHHGVGAAGSTEGRGARRATAAGPWPVRPHQEGGGGIRTATEAEGGTATEAEAEAGGGGVVRRQIGAEVAGGRVWVQRERQQTPWTSAAKWAEVQASQAQSRGLASSFAKMFSTMSFDSSAKGGSGRRRIGMTAQVGDVGADVALEAEVGVLEEDAGAEEAGTADGKLVEGCGGGGGGGGMAWRNEEEEGRRKRSPSWERKKERFLSFLFFFFGFLSFAFFFFFLIFIFYFFFVLPEWIRATNRDQRI